MATSWMLCVQHHPTHFGFIVWLNLQLLGVFVWGFFLHYSALVSQGCRNNQLRWFSHLFIEVFSWLISSSSPALCYVSFLSVHSFIQCSDSSFINVLLFFFNQLARLHSDVFFLSKKMWSMQNCAVQIISYFDYHSEFFMTFGMKRKLPNQHVVTGCDETVLFLLLLPALWPSA